MSRKDFLRPRWMEHEFWTGRIGSLVYGQSNRRLSYCGIRSDDWPRLGTEWLRYSAVWELGRTWDGVPYVAGTSGPAFKETRLGKDGFCLGLCDGIATSCDLDIKKECYATSMVP